jgi:hypothetical protein
MTSGKLTASWVVMALALAAAAAPAHAQSDEASMEI